MSNKINKVFVNLTNSYVSLSLPHPADNTKTIAVKMQIPSIVTTGNKYSEQAVKGLSEHMNANLDSIKEQIAEHMATLEIRDVVPTGVSGDTADINDLFGSEEEAI